jgi:hypothetical protein
MRIIGLVFAAVLSISAWAQNQDPLGSRTIDVSGPNAEDRLNALAANLKSVFELYQPQLDSDSQIVAPYTVSGSATQPEIAVSVQKCVSVVCETVDLDAHIALTNVKGDCDRNLSLHIDMSQSSSNLTDVYDALQVNICFHRASNGSGTLDVVGYAVESPTYSGGEVADQIFDFLQMQIDPMADAFQQSLATK